MGENNHHDLKACYSKYFGELYHYARTITNSTELAKDAVSDVFLYLLNSDTDLKHVKDIKSYLYKSVKNSTIRILSRDPIRQESLQDDIEFQMASEIDPLDLLLGKELELFILQAIDKLPPKAQLVFEMVRLKQMSYEEVSNELGISVNAVRNQLVSSTKVIRKLFSDTFTERAIFRISKNIGVLFLIGLSVIQ
ncbi:MAG: sigma-70 family RNA polymerase sigma factor [Cyclobacteriaceae bacterium]